MDSSGLATVTIFHGSVVEVTTLFEVGVASYDVILGMFVAQPPTGNGPNTAIWHSVSVTS